MVSLVDPCASYQMGRWTRAHVKPCSHNVVRKVKSSSQCKKRNSLEKFLVAVPKYRVVQFNVYCYLQKGRYKAVYVYVLRYGYQPRYPAEKRYYNIYVQHGSMHQKRYKLLRCSNGLQFCELIVHALLGYQLVMSTLLDNLAMVKHVDYIRVLNCAQSMCDGNCSTTLRSGVKGILYDALGCGVESRSSFVEKEDFGVAEEGTGNCQTLALERVSSCFARR